MSEVCNGFLNATSEKEAENIVETLLKKKLIAGASIFPTKTAYWWKGKIDKRKDFTILINTKKSNIEEIRKTIKAMHSDEVTGTYFIDIDSNKEFADWIKQYTK